MRNRINQLKKEFPTLLTVPSYIRQEFLLESLRRNNLSMVFICAIIFAVELFNIYRVLFLSKSGLTTYNNLNYFIMYCALIFLGVLWLVLNALLRDKNPRYRQVLQCALSWLMLLWHLGLNTYDLYRDPNSTSTTVLTTAVLALALLILVPPWYSVLEFTGGYLLFWIFMAPRLDPGSLLNLTITFVVSLAVSLAHSYHTFTTLQQQKQILQMNATLQELVQLDPLTRLLNKTTVKYRTEQLLSNLDPSQTNTGLTLFLLDLDDFKSVNDHYGHPCGDHVLVEMAEAMQRVFSHAAALGRIGGDEFAVLYDRPLSKSHAARLGQELIDQLKEIRWQDQTLEIRCSVGASICMLPNCTYHTLYTQTDQMLYQAKNSGKNRCCVQYLEPVGQVAPSL